MTKKCCPRVRVVCHRPKATTVTQSYYTLKDELAKPVKKTATVHVSKDAVCAVKLGSETLVSGLKVDDARLDKAISRGQDKLVARGCVAEAPILATVKPTPGPKYPDVPGEVVDALKAKVKKIR